MAGSRGFVTREGDAPREEHLSAEVLAVGAQLGALVGGRLGEDERVEVEANDWGELAEQLKEHLPHGGEGV